MEENLQGGEGQGLLVVENLYQVGLLGPATPAKLSLARPEFLLSIEEPFSQRCMRNFAAEYSVGNGFEEGGVNYTPPAAVEFGDLGSSGVNSCVIGTETETWTRRRSSIQEDLRRNQNYDGVENGEMLDGDSMHGVDPNSNHQGSNGSKFTNPLASSHGGDGGIAEAVSVSGSGSGRKRKKSETDVKRKPRVREKKHRPKIFDVMKPKKVPKPTRKKPNSEKKKKKNKRKDTTEKKKIKEAKKPKSTNKGRKKQKTLDSGNAILESSRVSHPQTPEQSEKNHRLRSSSEEYGMEASVCNKALGYDLGYDGDDAARRYNINTLLSLRKSTEKDPQLKVYTRQNRSRKKMDFDFDLNFNIQEFDFYAQLMSIVRAVKCKKKRKRRRKADAYPPVFENTKTLRKILPTFKQYSLAIMEPRHFRCVLFLKPILPPKKKRSKAVAAISGNAKLLPLYREIRKSAFARYLPLNIPRRKRSVTKRRHDLPISTSDFGSNLNEINRSKKIPLVELNLFSGAPKKEEVFCVDGKSSMITTPVEVVEPQKTQIQVHLPCNDGFHGSLISMLHYNDGKHELMKKIAEETKKIASEESSLIPRAVNYLLECSVVDLIRKIRDLSISNNCKQIVIHDQSSHGALVPAKVRTRKKKRPEPPKVIPDADAMKTWILLKEDGREKIEENYWKEQKEIFCGRVQMFIRCMHLIQGNRRFSRWKGSVVDSVIGVFLTQNVSDNMSSDAFMRFVARFPKHFDTPNTVSCLEGVTHSDTPNRDVRDEDGSLQNPAASSLERVTHSETTNGDVRDKGESLKHPVAPSFEGITYSGTPNKGVRDEGETLKNPTVPSFEGVSQNTDALNKYEVFPLTSEEATMINSKRKRTISKLPNKEPESQQNWEELRKEYDTISKDATCDIEDSVDWDAVRRASTHDVAETVGKRGMKNVLARIIKKFLDRLEEDHGKIDLEWLRNVPTEKVREYLLSFERIGLKSLDCVRLLTLHHHAFPVDTNVGRIVVRLGWVPLQPLPQGVEIHLLNDYPILAAIQEYLWPRLNALDQQTLYELHYQMITFGKVFCTKKKPRCNVCPMSRSCKHFASAQSAQLRLPSAQDKANEVSNIQIALSEERIQAYHDRPVASMELSRILDNLPLINEYQNELGRESQNCEPIIEIPASPETNSLEIPEIDIEDLSWDSKRNSEEELFLDLTQRARESNLTSEALVLLAPEATSFPVRKLKNARRLHTEHEVYVLPDDHPLLAQFRKRENDDPVNYLLAIWISDTGNQQDDQTVPGTILIPCRTANRGRFALNGTYFQVNEVFADYETSVNPINVPRSLLWNLPRRIIYCAPSGRSIFRDMTLLEIHNCFWNGYICVRSYDRRSREPSGLHGRFHLPKDLQKSEDNKRKTNSVNNSNNNEKKKKKKAEPKPKTDRKLESKN